jgi:hypothetical protein
LRRIYRLHSRVAEDRRILLFAISGHAWTARERVRKRAKRRIVLKKYLAGQYVCVRRM